MELIDGLEKYKSYTADYAFTINLETQAEEVLSLLKEYSNQPTESALKITKSFLLNIEKWKANCLQQRMGNAERNSESNVWYAFQGAACASRDIEVIKSIMQLKGFGSSVDEETGLRRAKVATAVLRFLWPNKWGVVDWRVAEILILLGTNNGNIDKVLSEAKKLDARELRCLFDFIDEHYACEINREFRVISLQNSYILPRAADVDMALFGISLMAWPMQ
jgi:hypothetical protein